MNHVDAIPVAIAVRVSSKKQDFQRQIEELSEFAKAKGYIVTKIIKSIVSGNKSDRPDLEELFSLAKKGVFKKVLVLEVSRLGRRAKDVRLTIDKLHSFGVSVMFKNLGIESFENGKEHFVTNIIISVYAEHAQEERRMLIERIESGLEQAKREGKTLGRKAGSKEDKAVVLKKYSKLIKDIKDGLSLSKCCKIHNLSKNTILKVKKLVIN